MKLSWHEHVLPSLVPWAPQLMVQTMPKKLLWHEHVFPSQLPCCAQTFAATFLYSAHQLRRAFEEPARPPTELPLSRQLSARALGGPYLKAKAGGETETARQERFLLMHCSS